MGHPTYVGDGNDEGVNHLSDKDWSAPRLSKSLLDAKVGAFDHFKTTLDKSGEKVSLQKDFATQLKSLLEHIEERLNGGLDEAWISPSGYALDNAKTLDRDTLGGLLFYNTPEEKWARAFSELFVFAMYGGAGGAYSLSGGDKEIYEAFPRIAPLAAACQHLSTICVLSRGFPLSGMQKFTDKAKTKPWATGCGCTGGTVDYDVWAKGEKFANGTKYTTIESYLTLNPTPGSVVVFNPGGPNYNDQDKSSPGHPTHIASVLRVSGARVQFIDTGVVIGSDEKKGEGGTADHSFLNGPDSIPGSAELIGVAVLPDASGVAEWAEKMAKTRPLGYLRLAIVDTTLGNKVRFVSKLLVMRHPISRLIWSLRGLPIENLSVFWMVYVPKFSWSSNLIADGAEGKPISELLKGTGSLHPTHVLRGEPDGTVRVFRRKTATGEDGFMEGLKGGTPKPPTPEMGGEYILRLAGDPKLNSFCMDKGTAEKRFIDAPGDAPASLTTDATGVALFDPS